MNDDKETHNQDTKKKKPLWPLVLINVVLFIILMIIIYFMFWNNEKTGAPASHIPAFGMQSAMGGGSFDNTDLESSGPFLLNIFASWCKPCEAEHPVLSDMVYKHNVPLYGIALKDDPDDLKAFLKRLGNPYHDIGMDNAGLMLSGLGVKGVPSTFVVDGDLKIHMIYEGPITEKIAQEKILPLVKKLQQN